MGRIEQQRAAGFGWGEEEVVRAEEEGGTRGQEDQGPQGRAALRHHHGEDEGGRWVEERLFLVITELCGLESHILANAQEQIQHLGETLM